MSGLFANTREHHDRQVSGPCRYHELLAGQASAALFEAPAAGAEAVSGAGRKNDPEVLKPLGYVSAHIGKWHLGPTAEYWPEKQGFDSERRRQ